MIRLDHTHVLTTFHRYRRDIPLSRKAGLGGIICTALEIHATLEERNLLSRPARRYGQRGAAQEAFPNIWRCAA